MLFVWGGMGLVPFVGAGAPFGGALVVHSKEWSTSYPEKGRIPAKVTKCRELVVHFEEWSTSFLEKGRSRAFALKKREPVVHFHEWSTGFPEKGRIPVKSKILCKNM